MNCGVIAYVCCVSDWTNWPARRAELIANEKALAEYQNRKPARIEREPVVSRKSFDTHDEAVAAVLAARVQAAAANLHVLAWVEVLRTRRKPSEPPQTLPGADAWPLQINPQKLRTRTPKR
jgi:hypothetical protein